MKKYLVFLLVIFVLFTGCSKNEESSSVADPRAKWDDPSEYKYGLTFCEYRVYLLLYGFISRVDYVMTDPEIEIDVKITPNTEYVVNKFNETFFNTKEYYSKEYKEDVEAAKRNLKKFNITKENPLTAEWVFNNPYNAYHLLISFPEGLKYYITNVPYENDCFHNKQKK